MRLDHLLSKEHLEQPGQLVWWVVWFDGFASECLVAVVLISGTSISWLLVMSVLVSTARLVSFVGSGGCGTSRMGCGGGLGTLLGPEGSSDRFLGCDDVGPLGPPWEWGVVGGIGRCLRSA